jgi:hypothetical protein
MKDSDQSLPAFTKAMLSSGEIVVIGRWRRTDGPKPNHITRKSSGGWHVTISTTGARSLIHESRFFAIWP